MLVRAAERKQNESPERKAKEDGGGKARRRLVRKDTMCGYGASASVLQTPGEFDFTVGRKTRFHGENVWRRGSLVMQVRFRAERKVFLAGFIHGSAMPDEKAVDAADHLSALSKRTAALQPAVEGESEREREGEDRKAASPCQAESVTAIRGRWLPRTTHLDRNR